MLQKQSLSLWTLPSDCLCTMGTSYKPETICSKEIQNYRSHLVLDFTLKPSDPQRLKSESKECLLWDVHGV